MRRTHTIIALGLVALGGSLGTMKTPVFPDDSAASGDRILGCVNRLPPEPAAERELRHRRIIERRGFFIRKPEMDGDRCRFCGTVIPGVWQA